MSGITKFCHVYEQFLIDNVIKIIPRWAKSDMEIHAKVQLKFYFQKLDHSSPPPAPKKGNKGRVTSIEDCYCSM